MDVIPFCWNRLVVSIESLVGRFSFRLGSAHSGADPDGSCGPRSEPCPALSARRSHPI